MDTVSRESINDEDQFVAELHQLGITFLSNRPILSSVSSRSPEQILANAMKQQSSRVRTAVIALFLLHPDYAQFIPTAFGLLNESQSQILKIFYTASVHLQYLYEKDLIAITGSELVWLPDLFGEELGISVTLSPHDKIQLLGIKHQEFTQSFINWTGTYKNVANHLIRNKQREAHWNQLHQTLSNNF